MGKNYKGLYRLGFKNVAVGRTSGVFLYENVWPFRRDKIWT